MDIIIAPIHETFFAGRIWMGLDIAAIKKRLETFNHTVQIIDFSEIASNYALLPLNALLFYTVSYNEAYLQYIKDVILDLSFSRKDIRLLPDLDQLFAFENKGYQELIKRRLGIEKVSGRYYGDIEDYFKDDKKLAPPFVYKSLKGAMSSGVKLLKTENELHDLDKESKKLNYREKLQLWIRLFNKTKKKIKISDQSLKPVEKYSTVNFNKFLSKRNAFVAQQFIPGLQCDYKVLIFGTRFYILERKTRKDDFRASGSGLFKWVDAPEYVLNFANDIGKNMKVSILSLDIVENESECSLIEFQGTGFGPLTLTNSPFYYTFNNNKWNKILGESNLEEEYANAILYYLDNLQSENS